MKSLKTLQKSSLFALVIALACNTIQAWDWKDSVATLKDNKALIAVGALGLAVSGYLGFKLRTRNAQCKKLRKDNAENILTIKHDDELLKIRNERIKALTDKAILHERNYQDVAAELKKEQRKVYDEKERNKEYYENLKQYNDNLIRFQKMEQERAQAREKEKAQRELDTVRSQLAVSQAQQQKDTLNTVSLHNTLALLTRSALNVQAQIPAIVSSANDSVKRAKRHLSYHAGQQELSLTTSPQSFQRALNETNELREALKRHGTIVGYLNDRWTGYDRFAQTLEENFKSVSKVDIKDLYKYLKLNTNYCRYIPARNIKQHIDKLKEDSKDDNYKSMLRQIEYVFANPVTKENYDAFVAGKGAFDALKDNEHSKAEKDLPGKIETCMTQLQEHRMALAELENTLTRKIDSLKKQGENDNKHRPPLAQAPGRPSPRSIVPTVTVAGAGQQVSTSLAAAAAAYATSLGSPTRYSAASPAQAQATAPEQTGLFSWAVSAASSAASTVSSFLVASPTSSDSPSSPSTSPASD